MPLPGRVPAHRDKVLVLPADITKITVYSKYKQACSLSDLRVAGKSKFYQVWQEILPHISVSIPSTDLCFTCQKNNLAIQRSACLSDDEKVQCLTTAEEHLFLAQSERKYYNTPVKRVNESLCTLQQGEKPPLSHYSFDFAQQVHFPFSAQQTGPEYFKIACKCGIFWVCNDGENKQVTYLIDEAENPGKGADCVIRVLHHYLEHHAAGKKNVCLHADNCVGQNKNNATIQYLMWRVLTGRHDSAELSFMLVGHTKFPPDRFFGIFKKAFRPAIVGTIFDIARMVSKSTSNGQHVPQLIRDMNGSVQVRFYQWSAHFSKFFRNIPNILSYHNFFVSKGLSALEQDRIWITWSWIQLDSIWIRSCQHLLNC